MNRRDAVRSMLQTIGGSGLILGMFTLAGCGSGQEAVTLPNADEIHESRLKRGMYDDPDESPKGRGKSKAGKKKK